MRSFTLFSQHGNLAVSFLTAIGLKWIGLVIDLVRRAEVSMTVKKRSVTHLRPLKT